VPSGRWSSLASAERRRKVNEAIRKVLSEALPALKDPRIGFVTVTGVRTSTDISQAAVFVSVLGSEREQARTLEGLQSAAGVLQAQVARELGTRRTPVLTFEYDPAIERGVRLTKLIDELAPADAPLDEAERDDAEPDDAEPDEAER
jgi:ribosome-binding factor A